MACGKTPGSAGLATRYASVPSPKDSSAWAALTRGAKLGAVFLGAVATALGLAGLGGFAAGALDVKRSERNWVKLVAPEAELKPRPTQNRLAPSRLWPTE